MADIKLQASRLLSKQHNFPRASYYEIKRIAGPDKDGSVYAIVDYHEDKNANTYVTDRVLKLDMKNRRIQWLHKVTGSLTNWEEIVGRGVSFPAKSGSPFVVSGDGTKLYFLTTDMEIDENRYEKPVRNTLYEYDTITGIERSVAHVPDFFGYGFFVSPDGSKLLVPHHNDEQGDSVGQVYDLKNGKVHSLACSVWDWYYTTSMCFSNDGNRIVITRRETSDDTYEAAMVFNADTGLPLLSEDKVIHRSSEVQLEDGTSAACHGGISSSCVAPIPGGYLFAFSDGFVKTDENLNQVEYMQLDGKDMMKVRAPSFFMLDAQCRFGLVAWFDNFCYVDFEEHTYCDDITLFDCKNYGGEQVILFSRDGSKLYSDFSYGDRWHGDGDTVWEGSLSGLPMKPFAAPKPAEPEFDWSVFNEGDN
ncbi:hypothetical protein [Bifidobacterium pullorum]|uniref:hypothetical protein n=1 Tax=Bifidobacterium pullorum TaxID=78448 RepID=UPI0032083ABD